MPINNTTATELVYDTLMGNEGGIDLREVSNPELDANIDKISFEYMGRIVIVRVSVFEKGDIRANY